MVQRRQQAAARQACWKLLQERSKRLAVVVPSTSRVDRTSVGQVQQRSRLHADNYQNISGACDLPKVVLSPTLPLVKYTPLLKPILAAIIGMRAM